MGSVLILIQTLKEYFSCHVYCAHLGTPWYQNVGASCTVSNWESRYPQARGGKYETVSKSAIFRGSILFKVQSREWSLRKKGKKQKFFLVLSPRPGPDVPDASGFHRRLREPISPFSMFNSVQL